VFVSEAHGGGQAPLALVLVRNTVTHDARVLREADTLHGLGFTVLVAGVVSTTADERRLQIGGAQIVRLAPAAALRRWLGWLMREPAGHAARTSGHRPPSSSDDRAPSMPTASASEAARRRALRQRLRQLAVTVAYYVQGIALVRRTSPVLVHSNDYNTMWIGIAAKLLRRSRLVYDCHELWADRNGRPEWRPWLVACEALFVRIADVTITTSPAYAATIASRYRVPPPVLVRNVPARGRPPRASPDRPVVGARPLAVYLGGLMPGRGLEQAIDALVLVPELRLRLIGPGRDSYRTAVMRRIGAAGVGDRVEVWPAVSPAEALHSIGDGDMGLMLIQPVCLSYELTLPNKLFEYAVAGLPILTSDLPVIGPLVRAEAIGEVVPATDVELIARAMRRLADPSVNAKMRERVVSFANRMTWEAERAVLERVYTGSNPRPDRR
jgi:glycosyltransferase involved in cell wall biosynthesis